VPCGRGAAAARAWPAGCDGADSPRRQPPRGKSPLRTHSPTFALPASARGTRGRTNRSCTPATVFAMGVDWDSLLGYKTQKVVTIRDSRLGALNYTLMFAVVVYIVVILGIIQQVRCGPYDLVHAGTPISRLLTADHAEIQHL
jgi:hypothetical protein